MKPSFLQSTLSLAFILCVAAVIVLMFMNIEINDKLLSVVTAVVGAYISARGMSNSKEHDPSTDLSQQNKLSNEILQIDTLE